MREEDLNEARHLLANKRDIRSKACKLSKTLGDTVGIMVDGYELKVRCSTLKELLDKELTYLDKRLKSLGVTELT